MKKIMLVIVAALLATAAISAEKRYGVYGVMFYNLENMFDTINNNGKYDSEFTPDGARKWNGQKYWSKQHNMAYAISQMKTKHTPMGPAIVGVSEVENKSVLQDLVRQPEIKDWHMQIVHHDSPDRRGIDVAGGDPDAVRRQSAADGEADVARRARHERHAAVKCANV